MVQRLREVRFDAVRSPGAKDRRKCGVSLPNGKCLCGLLHCGLCLRGREESGKWLVRRFQRGDDPALGVVFAARKI